MLGSLQWTTRVATSTNTPADVRIAENAEGWTDAQGQATHAVGVSRHTFHLSRCFRLILEVDIHAGTAG